MDTNLDKTLREIALGQIKLLAEWNVAHTDSDPEQVSKNVGLILSYIAIYPVPNLSLGFEEDRSNG